MVKERKRQYKFIKGIREARSIFRTLLYVGLEYCKENVKFDSSKGYYITLTNGDCVCIKNDYEIFRICNNDQSEQKDLYLTNSLYYRQIYRYEEYRSSMEEFTKSQMRREVEIENEGNCKKFKLSLEKEDEFKLYKEHVVYFLRRIIALEDIKNDKGKIIVRKGDKGGYVLHMSNLSQEGSCWIHDDSMVYDNAIVSDDAQVSGRSLVTNSVQIFGKAKVFSCNVHQRVKIYGNAEISHSYIGCDAEIFGNVKVMESSVINYAKVCGNAVVKDSEICGTAIVSENQIIEGQEITGDEIEQQ